MGRLMDDPYLENWNYLSKIKQNNVEQHYMPN